MYYLYHFKSFDILEDCMNYMKHIICGEEMF